MLLELAEVGFTVMLLVAFASLLYLVLDATLTGVRKWFRLRAEKRKGRTLKLVCHAYDPWFTIDMEHMKKAKENEENNLSMTLNKVSQVLDKSARHRIGRFGEELDKPFDRNRLDKSPSRAELDRLKRALKLPKGSVCFKHGSVYVVESVQGKHIWTRLGAWDELKARLCQQEWEEKIKAKIEQHSAEHSQSFREIE